MAHPGGARHLRKGRFVLCQGVRVRYAFIHAHRREFMDVIRTASDPTVTCMECAVMARLEVAHWAAGEVGGPLWFAWAQHPEVLASFSS